MGLHHSTYLAYGVEIPASTDFDHLDQVLAEQPGPDRITHHFLGDFERLFLNVHAEEVEPNAAATVGPTAYTRYEIPAWNRALHDTAVRLGYPKHGLPGWLVLHDHS